VSENVQKLIGVVVMAVLVVVGVAVSSGDDTDFSRNRSFRETAGTFAGADRVKEADCCDENAYRISKLETQLAGQEAELDELQQLQPSIAAFLNSFSSSDPSEVLEEAAEGVWKECPRPSFWQFPPFHIPQQYFQERAACFHLALVGLEINLAKAIVELDEPGLEGEWAGPNFKAFHRSSRADYSSDVEMTSEACLPIFAGGHNVLLALDTVAGVVAHPTLSSFYAAVTFKPLGESIKAMTLYSSAYSPSKWAKIAAELC
jgi:hypothetical protein